VKVALKALSLSHEPPAYVADDDCDAILRGMGLPLSKLSKLQVDFDGRQVNKAESFFSKTKAAHRCAARAAARAARRGPPRMSTPEGCCHLCPCLTRLPRAAPPRLRAPPASCRTSRPRRGRVTTR
jgi:hypothetical protein